MSDRKKPYDLIRRGEKKPTLTGTLTFAILRLADLPLQYALLSPSPPSLGVRILTSFGLRTIFTDAPASIPPALLRPLDASRSASWLTSLPPTGVLLFLMSVGSAAKQIYWQTALSQESFPAGAAAAVSAYNTAVNSANALLFVALGTTSLLSWPRIPIPFTSTYLSPSSSPDASTTLILPLSTIIGALLYITGITIETLAERQRARFKQRRENAGKLCTGGLWRWARHANYFGYTLWRCGYCMVGAGWVGGVVMGAVQGWDLGTRAVAVQDAYCSGRYGEQWARYKREVPYRIVPGVY